MKKSTNNSLVKKLTIKQMEEIVSKANIPKISQETVNKFALKFFKDNDRWIKRNKYGYKRIYRFNVGYQTSKYVGIFEISFKINKDYSIELANINPFHCYFEDKHFSNSYFVMGNGGRSKYIVEGKYRKWSSSYGYYWLESQTINYGIKGQGKGLPNGYDKEKYINSICETAGKEKGIGYASFLTSPKGLVELDLLNLLEKKDLKKFLSMKLLHNELSIYRDFLRMNRNRKGPVSKFSKNGLGGHDEGAGIHADKEAREFVRKNLPNAKDIYQLKKVADLNELKLIGKQQKQCVGTTYKDFENFYIAVTDNGVKLTIHWKQNKIQQVRAYANESISKELTALIERKIKHESRKIKTNY